MLVPEPAVALEVCAEGTNFDAVDDELARVFLVICATREEIHLQLMARVTWLVRHNDFMAGLREASSAEEIMELLRDRKGPLGQRNGKGR